MIFTHNKTVANLYDYLLANVYDLFMAIFAPGYRETITNFYQKYLNHLQGVSRVLEVGPGTGYVTKIILDRLPEAELTCVDLSGKMLAKLRKNVKESNAAGTPSMMQGDITQRLEIGDNTFDLVVIQGVIEHLAQVSDGIREINRLLKPGGKVIIGDIKDNFWGRLFSWVFRVHHFKEGEMYSVMKKTGFREIRFMDYHTRYFYLKNTLLFLVGDA